MPSQDTHPILAVNPAAGDAPKTMSAQEIADLTGKTVKNVIRDVREMAKSLYGDDGSDLIHLTQQHQGIAAEADERGYVTQVRLDRDHTMTLMTGYSTPLRHTVMKRWAELERATVLPNFADEVAAARAWADEREQRLIAARELEHERAARILAERTKAQIGDRRQATAMKTASDAMRKARKLEVELDRSSRYATLKRMALIYHGQRFDWRKLRNASAALGVPPIDVFDANYGTVKAYHFTAWLDAYALEIPAQDGETGEAE